MQVATGDDLHRILDALRGDLRRYSRGLRELVDGRSDCLCSVSDRRQPRAVVDFRASDVPRRHRALLRRRALFETEDIGALAGLLASPTSEVPGCSFVRRHRPGFVEREPSAAEKTATDWYRSAGSTAIARSTIAATAAGTCGAMSRVALVVASNAGIDAAPA